MQGVKSLVRIFTFTRNLWPFYAAVTFFSVVVALLAQAQPLLMRGIVDELQGIPDGAFDERLLYLFVAGFFISDILDTILVNIQGYIGDILAKRLQKELSSKYYEHLLSLPQSYFDDELSGKVTARLNRGITQISNFVQMMSNSFVSFILTAVFSLSIVAYFSPLVALLLFTLYPIFIYLTVKSSNRWMKWQEKINHHQDVAFGRFQESITQVKVVKSFVREKSELKFFNSNLLSIITLTKPQSRLWHRKDVERKLVLNVIFGLVYALLMYQAINGQITLAETIMLMQFATLIKFPIFTVSFLVDNVQKAVADSKDYFEVMNLDPAINDKEGAKKLKINKAQIQFNDVEFAYDDKNVANGVTFTADPGDKIALVGESGEGKTTLANLLLRLYEPSNGSIKIDQQDISMVTQESLRKQIAVVFQDASLFSGTITENISYGAPKATQAQIVTAAKAANAHEFVSKLSDGYKTLIGEKGLKLSGGQKQRIAIARALLKDAPILILDEATSSLDSKSELLVQEALERLMKNRTTLIIAHRLSTIQNVDKIVTIKGGKVAEMGSPKQLSTTGGIYQQLLEVQSATTSEERKQALSKFGIIA